ncbi:MAG: VWA domain-containing protein [Fimbriimonadaceae bacterium]|nr:VWA domain-containing protein [Alphaproteobacteria bacterium]
MADQAFLAGQGKLADNIIHFTRLLRAAGLKIGPGQAVAALQALTSAGIGEKEDFYWVLHATLVSSHQQTPIFDQAFQLFWRKRGLIEKMMELLLPETIAEPVKRKPKAATRRVAEALADKAKIPDNPRTETEIDARLTFSDREILQSKDFEQMSAEEVARAKALVRQIILTDDLVKTRRFQWAQSRAIVDPRATMKASIRGGGDIIRLRYKTPKLRHPPLVALVDISGSMSGYSEIILHFLHALTNARPQVHTFLFGTRLTNITRSLRAKDPDDALTDVSGAVEDWSGGTRISDCVSQFNRFWSRRVLGQGAIVLLISDGLERGDVAALGREMERLGKSCRKLVWLNPLLRYDGFEALASGVRAILPHVDEFRAVHNLESIGDLAASLDSRRRDTNDPRQWLRDVG